MAFELKAPKSVVAAAYVVSLFIIVGALYYWYSVATMPQPVLVLGYNAMLQDVSGYMHNTLGYPILVTSYYCTVPDGTREIFAFNNQTNKLLIDNATNSNDTLGVNANVPVFLTVTQPNAILPADCANWKATYYRVTSSNTI